MPPKKSRLSPVTTSRRIWTPPAIPARRAGWEHGYVDVLNRHMALPFAWGTSDCMTVWADLCVSMTGIDPLKGLRRYSTELGAAKTMRRLGFADVEEMLAAFCPTIPVVQARRGDCGVLEQIIAGKPMLATVIIMGAQSVGKGETAPVFVPTFKLKTAFRVG